MEPLNEQDAARLRRAIAAGHRGFDVARRFHRRWDRLRKAGLVESAGKGGETRTGAWTVITFCATAKGIARMQARDGAGQHPAPALTPEQIERAARAGAKTAGIRWNSAVATLLCNAARFILEGDMTPPVVKAMKPAFVEAVRKAAIEQ